MYQKDSKNSEKMMSIKEIFDQDANLQYLMASMKMAPTSQPLHMDSESIKPLISNPGDISQIFSEFPGKIYEWRHSVTLCIPGTVDINVLADNSVYVYEAAKLMSELFGGTRIWQECGTWISQTNGLVTEENVWIMSHTDYESLCRNFMTVFDFICRMQETLRQEAMMLKIDGVVYCLNWTN